MCNQVAPRNMQLSVSMPPVQSMDQKFLREGFHAPRLHSVSGSTSKERHGLQQEVQASSCFCAYAGLRQFLRSESHQFGNYLAVQFQLLLRHGTWGILEPAQFESDNRTGTQKFGPKQAASTRTWRHEGFLFTGRCLRLQAAGVARSPSQESC